MALTRRFASNRSKQVRRNAAGSRQGSGDDRHAIVGSSGGGTTEYLYRSLIRFVPNWATVKRVVKIELAIKTETSSTHFTVGRSPRIRVQRLTHSFADGTAGENSWISGDYEWPTSTGGVEIDCPVNPATGLAQDEAWVFVDITTLMQAVVPKGVLMPSGVAGGGGTDYGLLLRSPGNEKSDAQRMIFYAFDSSGSANDPYILLTYDPVNRAPVAPALTGPATANNSFGDSFEGTHSDPDLDPMAAREIVVYPAGGSTPVWSLPVNLQSAASAETLIGAFSVPLTLAIGSLKLQTAYEWVARTKDPAGLWGPYSARRALRITSSPPTVVATALAPLPTMAGALFGGTYSDPENNDLAQFQLQMQPVSAHTDAAFADPATRVWDTGESFPSLDEVTAKLIARPYAGSPITAATYTYRIKVQDSSGAWSGWAYTDFTLTTNYDPDPGNVTLTTQIARNAPVRVALYRMGTLRGPGALIGYVDDPMDLGASAYLNSGGEVYFTLPALHPYCPSIEPHSTHYAVEQYYGDRYRVLFAGIITDFDADADTAVFYGTDYLGLLQTAVDERYDPNKPAVQATMSGGGGSYYVDKTIDAIIRDQLLYHKGLSNSPIGFITLGAMSALAERATIYSTWAEALPFISGLIDSHKQGTGREARFYARPTTAAYTAWEWALVDNWGHDRPNIELEYGGLLNDFRVVALGDFGTRVLGAGQKRGEVKVYRAMGTGGLDEAQWGRRAKTAFFADIIDQNDLQRRVNERASVLAKVGKRIALAIQADALSPFDGWDLGDSIKVTIQRGVVDTSLYGSGGYWTIYGIEWRYHPDGHTEMTLTTLPKKTATAPNPDLIPSVNPGVPDEWQVGYGYPTNYGDPPTASIPLLLRAAPEDVGISTMTFIPPTDDPVIAHWYTDLNTGNVYELDESTGTYTLVYTPPAGGGGGTPPDTTPPAVPIIKSTSSISEIQDDGTAITNLAAVIGYTTPPVGLTDLDQIIMQTTRFPLTSDPSLPDWTLATQWAIASSDHTGTLDTSVIQPGVQSATLYWLRAAAVDSSGNRSGWSTIVTRVTATDLVGPPVPTGIVVEAGMSTIGVRWDDSDAEDLSYNEVRWRVSPSGVWETARVAGTLMVIVGVTNETTYNVQVRAVDTSGNVLHDTGADDTDGNPIYDTVKAVEDPEAGWIAGANATPTALPGSALVWNSAIIASVFAGQINADWITAGTLRVGTGSGKAAAIEVYDSTGHLIGRWSTSGIEVMDPANPGYKLVITAAGLTIYTGADTGSPVAVVTMSPLGIDAASITFGSARGGHNLVQNSSFELGKFGVSAITNHTWDVTADYTATRLGSDTNLTVGASTIAMTTV